MIPFCTSASRDIGSRDKDLENLTKTGDWLNGKRFKTNTSSKEVDFWLNNLTLK